MTEHGRYRKLKISEEGRRRRIAAGVPEHLLDTSVWRAAREMWLSEQQLSWKIRTAKLPRSPA